MPTRDKVYIFDISGFIHRSFHTNLGLQTSYGMPTGSIFGTLSMMLRFIEKYHPTHLLICYDAQTPKSIRKDIYPPYKANRVKVEAVSQEERIVRRFFELLSLPAVELEGYEADDLIATATNKLKASMDVVVVTGDKDMLQLVEPGVQVFDPMKNIWYDEEEAQKKFGVRANQIADYLALAGDTADNIPGAAGIGPKAAADLLSRYQDVEEILNMILSSSPEKKYQEKLLKSKDTILVSKLLTTLFDNLPIKVTAESTQFKPKDNPEIYPLLEKLEFKSLGIKIELMWQAYSG